jgi:sigma-B regulation protein RsbU (phosphoserine phosphatase)
MPESQGLFAKIESTIGQSLLKLQVRLAVIAVIVVLSNWFSNGSPFFLTTFIYTFIIGNVTAPLMGGLGIRIESQSPLRQWISFILFLIPVGILGASLASAVIYYVPPVTHTVSLPEFVLKNMRMGALITVLVSIVSYRSARARNILEEANRQLRDQVTFGTIQLQHQAADLQSAHEIQTHLIPTDLPQIAGLQISGAWQPAQAVGGDYFDVLSFSPTRLGICIADVSGKGMGAALLMANFQAAFRAFATEDTAPDILCSKLNRTLSSTIAPGKFVTLFYGIIDMTYLLFDYANAGHSQPILLRGDTTISLKGGGTVLGLFPHLVYDALTIGLLPGDCLLLTTDGITEAAHPDDLDDEFGEARLIACAQRFRNQGAHAIRSNILKEVTAFCDGHFQDDATLIVLTMDGTEAKA